MLNAVEILPGFGANNIAHEYNQINECMPVVGFDSGRNVWHWFMILSDGVLMFHHSYSQVTGKTHKGYAKGKTAERLAIKFASIK